MKFFSSINWLKAPPNHAIISRWTAADGDHGLDLQPGPRDPSRFEFLVLGDTGDSEIEGARVSRPGS